MPKLGWWDTLKARMGRNPLAGIEVLWIPEHAGTPDEVQRAVVIPSRGLRCFGSTVVKIHADESVIATS